MRAVGAMMAFVVVSTTLLVGVLVLAEAQQASAQPDFEVNTPDLPGPDRAGEMLDAVPTLAVLLLGVLVAAGLLVRHERAKRGQPKGEHRVE